MGLLTAENMPCKSRSEVDAGTSLTTLHLTADEDYICFTRDWSPGFPGAGLRLSWPYAGGHRRALLGKAPFRGEAASRKPHADKTRIVYVSQQDMEMHYHLSRPVSNGKSAGNTTRPGFNTLYCRMSPANLGDPTRVESGYHRRWAAGPAPTLWVCTSYFFPGR
jgi:hypothetical protein